MTGEALLVSAPAPLDEENPWPGLLPFNERDQAYFRGRTAEADELLRLVKRELLTVLFGLSGLGKSSLLQAGLFPLLRIKENILPVLIRLDFKEPVRDLSRQVLDAVTTQAAAADIEAPVRRENDTLWEYFHRRNADFWTNRNQLALPLLVFDQFEEIFTLGEKDADRVRATQAFIGELASLAEGKAPPAAEERFRKDPSRTEHFSFGRDPYKILLVLREDFLPDLEALAARMSGIMQNRMRLKSMNGVAALEAVNQAPRIIDRAVAEQVVRFVAVGEGAASLASLDVEPAILSLVCSELNAKRKARHEPKITLDLLDINKEKVLEEFYEKSFVGQPRQVRVFVEDRLVDEGGFRNSESLVNAVAAGVTRDSIERLVARRLIRVEDLNGERLELIHDRLTGVVRASRERRKEVARRKRLFWTAFILGIALAVSLGVMWKFIRLSQEAEKQRREAQKQTEIAKGKTKDALDAKDQDDADKTRLVKSEGEAKAATALARANEQLAKGNAAKAAASEQSAKRSETRAEQNAIRASDQAVAAQKAQTAADTAAKEAHDAETKAQKAQIAAEVLQAQETQRAKIASAQADLSQAMLLVEKGRGDDALSYKQALAYLSQSLDSDPRLPAKAITMDLLIRGEVPVPISPLPGGNPDDMVDPVVFPPHTSPVLSARFDPNGPLVVTGDFDKQAALYDLKGAQNRILKDKDGHTGLVNSAVFSPDGSLVVTASQDGTALIWSVATGSEKTPALHHKGPVLYASFSADGRQIVTASWDKTARVWDTATGKQIAEFDHQKPVTSASFSPDGRVVTSCWDDFAYVRNAPTPGLTTSSYVYRLAHKGQVNFAAFSENGQRVVTASDDNTAQVWDGTQPIGEPMRHTARVNSAMFSPDGLRVVTASDDNTARVWDAATGKPIGIQLSHKGRVTSAAFNKDGSQVITASAYYDKDKKQDVGEVRIWKVPFQADDPALLAKLAEAVSGFRIEQTSFVPLANQVGTLNQLRDQAGQNDSSGTTASFVRWFFQRGNRIRR